MQGPKIIIADLVTQLRDSKELSEISTKVWVHRGKTIVIDFVSNGNEYGIDLNPDRGRLIATAVGRNNSSRRLLRNALIGSYEMKRRDGERHVLGPVSQINSSLEDVVINCVRKLKIITDLLNIQSLSAVDSPLDPSVINVFWWDARANFGDAVGPWLVAAITKKTPVSGRGRNLLPAPLMTVGSILNLAEQDDTVIWGSGLINTLSESRISQLKSLDGVKVCAVRGKLTRSELMEKVGWDVPEVYGDPALLLPRFLPVPRPQSGPTKTAVVPHYVHVDHFKDMGSDVINVVDVQTGLEAVVRQIASARVCISTSLHGLIIAQAYGIPWMWIRVTDDPLSGDTFKFNDFFSTLDGSSVSAVDVTKSEISGLDLEALAERAALPELQISLEDLLQAFPHHGDRMKSGQATIDDLLGSVAGLNARMESMAKDLAEQRRLLEQLKIVH